MAFLSFNPAVTPPDDLNDGDDDGLGVGGSVDPPMPLRSQWVVWHQIAGNGGRSLPYCQSTREVAHFGMLSEFWDVWGRLPQPSQLAVQRMVAVKEHAEAVVAPDGGDPAPPQPVDALMVFRKGVSPQWEDRANADGGHFQFPLKPAAGLGQVDEQWNNLVLGVVGGTIEPLDMITGVRLVDKASGLRVEVWFSGLRDTEAVRQLQHNVERCVATRTLDGRLGPIPKIQVNPHVLTRHQ